MRKYQSANVIKSGHYFHFIIVGEYPWESVKVDGFTNLYDAEKEMNEFLKVNRLKKVRGFKRFAIPV